MKRLLQMFQVLVLVMILAETCLAGQFKVFVPEFKVTGAANKDELKTTLPSLLASRLSTESTILVESPTAADLTVACTYIAFGKVFSLDALLKDSTGKVLGRAFEQGDSTDDIIPALSRLAQKLNAELAKAAPSVMASTDAQLTRQTQALTLPSVTLPQTAPSSVNVAPHITPQPAGDIIRPQNVTRAGESGMIGQRLDGAMVGLAIVKSLATSERELILALNNEIRLYRQGEKLTLLAAEKGFRANEKIIGIDTADLDGDGTVELYVTMLRGFELASQVWSVRKGALIQVARDLPYFFRALQGPDGKQRLYGQEMGRDNDYMDEIAEVIKTQSGYTLKNPLKLPRSATIFNFNRIREKDGTTRSLAINADGYLIVCAESGEELWRSNDRLGGSETYFSREEQNVRATGELQRKIFIEQRILVTPDNNVIVPKNDGFWVIGNSRSFSKNSVYSFTWNGAAMEERWHTKPSQNYLADYAYDDSRKELVMLEVVKKAGMVENGASAITIKKVE